MTKMSMKYVSPHMGEANPRKNILKLASHITSRIPPIVTTDMAEYWGLATICTDEMCDILLKMKVHKGYTMPQLKKMTGKDEAYLEDIMQKMSVVGLVEYNWENPQHEKQWSMPLFVPGSAEFTNMNMKQVDEYPVLASFFERLTHDPVAPISQMVPEGGGGIGMHVIPVEKAIDGENQAVSVEKISHWLEKYDGQIASSPCACRISRAHLDEGVPDDCRDWCIALGDMATYCVETGKGKFITKEKALEIFKQAEENGFVHQITNINGENKIFAICNCNPRSCYAIRTSQLFNTPNLSRSAYVAHVDKENCVACGKCVEVCPVGAVKLGQKLCTKHGEVKYKKSVLPDKIKWTPAQFNDNYRDDAQLQCHESGTAPCKTACPAHIAVQGYLKLASQGKFREALELIKKDNPFPAVCGRICNRKCEDACTRGTIDSAVAIDAVKKYVSELELNPETRVVPKKIIARIDGDFSDDKVAIIGAGPAGLSCAYYLALKGYKPVVFEKNELPGGMLTYGIPSYKLENNVIQAEVDILRELGVEIKCGIEVGKDITIPELRKEGYKGFYIAIGLQSGNQMANIPGHGADCHSAVEILKLQAENKLTVKDNVLVIGGGNVAIDAARTSKRHASGKVTMVCLEDRMHMPATEAEILEALDEGVELLPQYALKEIVRVDGNITKAILKKCISVFDAENHFNPQYDENDLVEVLCNEVIYSIGQKADYGKLLEGTEVKLTKRGLIEVDPVTYQTSDPDIFAGGDLTSGPSFAINAIAAGREGAVSLNRYVQHHGGLKLARNLRKFYELDKNDIVIDSYDEAGRYEEKMDESIDYRHSFKDAHLTMTEEEVLKETKRCLGCGVSVVDENRCIGCGLCTTKCEFDAIHLKRDHPKCSRMYSTENQMKAILPYTFKRWGKIMFAKKTPDELEAMRKNKEWKRQQKVEKKESK